MFCMNCGTKLPEGAKFCLNCGTPVGGTHSTKMSENSNPVNAVNTERVEKDNFRIKFTAEDTMDTEIEQADSEDPSQDSQTSEVVEETDYDEEDISEDDAFEEECENIDDEEDDEDDEDGVDDADDEDEDEEILTDEEDDDDNEAETSSNNVNSKPDLSGLSIKRQAKPEKTTESAANANTEYLTPANDPYWDDVLPEINDELYQIPKDIIVKAIGIVVAVAASISWLILMLPN